MLEPGKVPVMIVEDDPADAFALERILAGSVYQPLRVHNVRHAQHLLQQVTPAAVMLDIMLLGEESWRLLLQLRNDEAKSEVPLVVMSSSGEDRKAAHLGADEYLAKPIDGAALLGLLDRLDRPRQSITNVLLVDDEEITRYLVRQLLPRSRYHLVAVDNGEAGLTRLQDQPPDVVLLDINMPGMDGYQFLARLNNNPLLARIPAIVLTSAILQPHERSLLQHASMVMSKSSLSSSTLIEAIQGVVHRVEPALTA